MVSVIVAVAQNGVIGCANKLIWHIGEDLRRFRDITTGHPVIMGRKTFESIGKPLPNRTNVVVTRNREYRAEGVLTANSLEAAIAMFSPQEEVFVIGGGEIYAQAMPLADKLYLTLVAHNYLGDTIFPDWEGAQWSKGAVQGWVETSREEFTRGAKFEYPFSFIDYKKEE